VADTNRTIEFSAARVALRTDDFCTDSTMACPGKEKPEDLVSSKGQAHGSHAFWLEGRYSSRPEAQGEVLVPFALLGTKLF
jgi:hypothetical protein